MLRLFLCSFATAFAIIGSIIGAGFITGKEVFEFFARDFSLSGIYLTFLCFSIAIYFVMSNLEGSAFARLVEIFVSLANVVVAGCMISALNSVYNRLFRVSEKSEIFTVITAILIFIMSFGEIGFVEKLCVVTLPIVITAVVALCITRIDDYAINISPKSYGGVVKPVIYVGFNVILSSGVIKNSGKKLSPLFKILSSVITSLIICACVSLLSLAVAKEGNSSEMPFISLFDSNKKLLIIIDIITLFAIYSTLVSAFYTVNNFGGIKIGYRLKILLFILTFAISRLGFSSIVEGLYPTLGILAYLVLAVSFLLSRSFPKEKRERTYLLQADRV